MTKPLGFYMNCPIAPELAELEAQSSQVTTTKAWNLLCELAANQASMSDLIAEKDFGDDYTSAIRSRNAIFKRLFDDPILKQIAIADPEMPSQYWRQFLAWCNEQAMESARLEQNKKPQEVHHG